MLFDRSAAEKLFAFFVYVILKTLMNGIKLPKL